MNDNRHNDYLTILFFIALWTMILAIAQCSTSEKLDDIAYELRMMN